jgi:hypothetical protein
VTEHGYAAGQVRHRVPGGWLTVLAVLAAVAGTVMIYVSQHTHRWAAPPVPPAAAAGGHEQAAIGHPAAHPVLARPVPSQEALRTGTLGRSAPVRVRIPAIGVDANLGYQ